MKYKTGDIILPVGSTAVAKLIRAASFGEVCHAALVFDSDTSFESDGAWRKAKFFDVNRFDGMEFYHIRPLYKLDVEKIKERCTHYENFPYSYWDIATNAAFSWLEPHLRVKAVKFFGTKHFMICSELVSRIMWEATGRSEFEDYEGMQPEALRVMGYMMPNDYKVTHVEA